MVKQKNQAIRDEIQWFSSVSSSWYIKAFELQWLSSRWRNLLQRWGGSQIIPMLFQIHWVTADTVKGMLIYLWTSLVSLGYFPALNFRGWHILDSCYGGLGLITIQLLGALLSENPANKQWNTLDLGLNCFLGPKLPKHEYKNYMKSELTNRAIR